MSIKIEKMFNGSLDNIIQMKKNDAKYNSEKLTPKGFMPYIEY